MSSSKRIFFATHHGSLSSPISILPLFSNSLEGQSSSFLVNKRQSVATQNQNQIPVGPLKYFLGR